jgi:uncharacterized protein (DUF885 family)
MRHNRTAIGLLLVLVLLALIYFGIRMFWLRPFSIGMFFERAYIEFLWDDPELLSVTGILEEYGLTGHRSRLTDASPARNEQLATIGRKNLKTLRGYDRNRLTASEQVSLDVMLWFLETGVAGEPFLFHDYPVTHLNGPHIDLPQLLMQVHPVKDTRDAQDYLSRLALFGEKFSQTIAALEHRQTLGIIAPTFILRRAIRQCDDFTAMQPLENVLYKHLESRMLPDKGFSDEQRERLLEQCQRHLIDHVYPAYKRLSGYLMQLEDVSMNVAGVWHLPDGEAYYRHCLLQQTTLACDPDELYDVGRIEMSRIEGEMRIILSMMGISGENETLSALMQRLSAENELDFSNDSAGAAACIDHFRQTIESVRPVLPSQFRPLPEMELEIAAVPEFRQNGAPLAYYVSPRKATDRPGRLCVNTSGVASMPRHLATVFAYHEGIPGHHLQKSVQANLTELPTFRRFLPFPAFSEGWAMYAEELGHWMTGDNDPIGRLAVLQSDLWRTARMVTDVGIHHRKWQRDQAIDFLVAHAALTAQEAEDEVDRYIVWPGQGCAYKVGKLEFLRLRQEYIATAGDSIDMRELHETMIGQGAMPLEILGRRLKEAAAERSAP